MNYVGIDIHKKYSVLCAQDEQGRKIKEARIEGNSAEEYAGFFGSLEGRSKVVLEACWNWGLTHDLLEEIGQVEEVVLAHPLKTRLIADAQIKTDRLDAHGLGTLLRGNLVARAHIPCRQTRARKNLLRQRLYWSRLHTMLRNRIHALLDRQRNLELPQCSDIFGVKGLGFLRALDLPEPDGTLLREQLALHDLIATQMRAQEKRIAAEFGEEKMHQRLLSLPGVGPTIASVIATELDDIARFPGHAQLCSVARGNYAHHLQLRRQDLSWKTAALLQQVAALGADRGKLGGHRLLTLLRRPLPASPRPRQESQHRHHHCRQAHVPHPLATAQGGKKL